MSLDTLSRCSEPEEWYDLRSGQLTLDITTHGDYVPVQQLSSKIRKLKNKAIFTPITQKRLNFSF